MAEKVARKIVQILTHVGNMDDVTALATLENIKKQQRYQEDIFG